MLDTLRDMQPGQRVMAEIQALLPNGTYRAMVAQRELTLALPFSAKPGDSLELEVQEHDGRVTLAVVTDRNAAQTKGQQGESVSTSLSQTGRLIGNLIAGEDNPQGRAAPLPLNGSQALIQSMPDDATSLLPILKQAISQSGMFYEAHQAKWVAGQLSTAALREEPQGKLTVAQVTAGNAPAAHGSLEAKTISLDLLPTTSGIERSTQPTGSLPESLVPIVRQQLDGLASNNFAWQGQIWPGQQMQWEIGEPPEERGHNLQPEQQVWQSRLKLTLPSLGSIDATIRLRPGGKVTLELTTASEASAERLRLDADRLNNQFAAANLDLIQLQFRHERSEG